MDELDTIKTMVWWHTLLIVVALFVLAAAAALYVAYRRTARERASLGTFLKEQGEDVVTRSRVATIDGD